MMNWLCSFVLIQCTLLFVHCRPDIIGITPSSERVTLETQQTASVAAIIKSLENGTPLTMETRKHLAANVAIAEPIQNLQRHLAHAAAEINKNTEASSSKNRFDGEKVTVSSATPTTTTAAAAATSTTTKKAATSAKPTRANEDASTKQKPLITVPPKTEKPPTTLADKPTIYDIINETERNFTLHHANRLQVTNSTTAPVALPLIGQPMGNVQRTSDTPKAIGHAGVAEALTWQQLESEMSMVEQNLKDSSTSKDGISTWILLSGSDKHQQMTAAPATTTIASTTTSHEDKLSVKDSLGDKHVYRLEEIHDKFGKPNKHREPIDINKKPKPDKIIKNKIQANNGSFLLFKTTTPSTTTQSSILVVSDFTTETKNRRKPPTIKFTPLKRKPTPTTAATTPTPTTTTTTTTEYPVTADPGRYEDDRTEYDSDDSTTPVAFIVLEPKEADFDLPQDRSPATKKPTKAIANKATKRKPAKKNKVTTLTKTPTKLKEKPISSTIYSYLSREVMPTVGVGLMGLVLTAGIASYLFGPLGALRRSYDDASDRKDNVDSIYSVNNEEYAGEGADNGQNEEEIFGKFLAGMPANYVPRYVKYFRNDGSYQAQPGISNNNYPYRRVANPQQQQQQQPQQQPQQQLQQSPQPSNMVPKYSAYTRTGPSSHYRTAPSPHYNNNAYNAQPQQYPAYRNYHVQNSQPIQSIPQQQPPHQQQQQQQLQQQQQQQQQQQLQQEQQEQQDQQDEQLQQQQQQQQLQQQQQQQQQPQQQQQQQHQHQQQHREQQQQNPQISPVYNPQYHDLQKQKSFANNMDAIIKHQSIIYGKKSGYASPVDVVQEKSAEIAIEAESEEMPAIETDVINPNERIDTDIIDDANMNVMEPQMQRRTNTFVVGSEAVVSASMAASDDLNKVHGEAKSVIEPVTVVTASHGPRRRRRDTMPANETKANETSQTAAKESNNNDSKGNADESSPVSTTSPPMYLTRLYSVSEMASLESEFNTVRENIMSLDREYSNADAERKIEKKIHTELRSISNDFDTLKKAIDGVKSIEQLQKQLRIRGKNFELSVVLKTAITTIRQRIKYLSELVERPEDDRLIEKINRRDGNATPTNGETQTTTTPAIDYDSSSIGPEMENGFVGFLKLLQLKAQFGLNLLQNIRPSFERAFEDVFKRPYENNN